MAAPANQPENQSEKNTQDDGRGKGKINDRVLAAIDEISRQPSDGQIGFAGNEQYRAHNHNHASDQQQKFPKLRHNRIIGDSNAENLTREMKESYINEARWS